MFKKYLEFSKIILKLMKNVLYYINILFFTCVLRLCLIPKINSKGINNSIKLVWYLLFNWISRINYPLVYCLICIDKKTYEGKRVFLFYFPTQDI